MKFHETSKIHTLSPVQDFGLKTLLIWHQNKEAGYRKQEWEVEVF
jgi:hypothetical protein